MVDTPGFDDTNRSDVDVLQQVAYFLAGTYKDNKKFSGIIYLHNIGQSRTGRSAIRSLMVAEKMLGQDALSQVLFTTTHWDSVNGSTGAAREAALISDFWEPFIAKGARCARFTGSSTSARSIVSAIIERSTEFMPVPLEIQHELVEQGMTTLAETAAAQVLHRELLQVKRKSTEETELLQHEISEAVKLKDEEALNALERHRGNFEKEMVRIGQEQETLKSSNYTQIRSLENERDEWKRKYEILRREYLAYAKTLSSMTPMANPTSTDDFLVDLALRFLIPLDAVSRHIRRLVHMISGKSFKNILRPKVAKGYTRVTWTCVSL